MPTHSPVNSDASLASLIGGIINDAKDLLVHEVVMAKLEMQNELRRTKAAAISLAIGAGIIFVGGVLLILMLVHLLNAFTTIPLWGCYGLMGGGLLLIGFMIVTMSKPTVEPDHVVLQQPNGSLKEHVQWSKEQTPSNRT